MSTSTSIQAPVTLKSLLDKEGYRKRLQDMLGRRSEQFISSVISLGQQKGLKDCDPNSILAGAMIAATLDFPVDKNLGFAWLVPYKGVAQFQLGYKGFIQLGLRSGAYQRMNAMPINAEAWGGYDDVGEPRIKWDQFDDSKPVAGYVFAYRLTNGFTKVAYWTKAKVQAHAQRYSQAVKGDKKDSPWFTDFDAMALKTLIKHTLSHWGLLSVEMRVAIEHDQGAQKDVDAAVEYPDGPATIDVDATVVDESKKKAKAPVELTPEQKAALAKERQQVIDDVQEMMLDHDLADEKALVKLLIEREVMAADWTGNIFEVSTELLKTIRAELLKVFPPTT